MYDLLFLVRLADLKKPIEFRLTELTDETLMRKLIIQLTVP